MLTSNLSFLFHWQWNPWSCKLLKKKKKKKLGLCHVACGILVTQPGIEPRPPALEAWSLNHWATIEVSGVVSLPGGLRSWQKDWRQYGHGFGGFFTAYRVEPHICSITLVLPILQSLWGVKMAAAKESFFHLCTVPPGLTKLFWTKLASAHCPGLSGHPLCAQSLPLCTPRSRCGLEGCLISGKGGTTLVSDFQQGGRGDSQREGWRPAFLLPHLPLRSHKITAVLIQREEAGSSQTSHIFRSPELLCFWLGSHLWKVVPLLMETHPFLLFVQLREGEREIQKMYELGTLKIMFQRQSCLYSWTMPTTPPPPNPSDGKKQFQDSCQASHRTEPVSQSSFSLPS